MEMEKRRAICIRSNTSKITFEKENRVASSQLWSLNWIETLLLRIYEWVALEEVVANW